MDALSEMLCALRLADTHVVECGPEDRNYYRSPTLARPEDSASPFLVSLQFHVAAQGKWHAWRRDVAPVELLAGDFLLCSSGTPCFFAAEYPRQASSPTLLHPQSLARDGDRRLTHQSTVRSASSALILGHFVSNEYSAIPLNDLLNPALHIRCDSNKLVFLKTLLSAAVNECRAARNGRQAVVERMVELALTSALQEHFSGT